VPIHITIIYLSVVFSRNIDISSPKSKLEKIAVVKDTNHGVIDVTGITLKKVNKDIN
jgi:hypothetical protein